MEKNGKFKCFFFFYGWWEVFIIRTNFNMWHCQNLLSFCTKREGSFYRGNFWAKNMQKNQNTWRSEKTIKVNLTNKPQFRIITTKAIPKNSNKHNAQHVPKSHTLSTKWQYFQRLIYLPPRTPGKTIGCWSPSGFFRSLLPSATLIPSA